MNEHEIKEMEELADDAKTIPPALNMCFGAWIVLSPLLVSLMEIIMRTSV